MLNRVSRYNKYSALLIKATYKNYFILAPKPVFILLRALLLLCAFQVGAQESLKSRGLNMQQKDGQQRDGQQKYGSIVRFEINKKIEFSDGLSVVLVSFTHKKPYKNGPTKATAYLLVSLLGVSDKISLSIHGIQGEGEMKMSYDRLKWHDYNFYLKNFTYNDSVEVLVEKN